MTKTSKTDSNNMKLNIPVWSTKMAVLQHHSVARFKNPTVFKGPSEKNMLLDLFFIEDNVISANTIKLVLDIISN